MADFEAALAVTLQHEGGYVSDPDDPGGETYKGVGRKKHPEWDGWELVDWLKEQPGFPKSLDQSDEISRRASEFYRREFWDRLNVGSFANQTLAAKVFDTAVDCGLGFAASALQEAMCYCGVPVKVDGLIGPKTIEVLNLCQGDNILGEYRELVAQHYRELAEKNRKFIKYLGSQTPPRGWLGRAYS